MIYRPRFAALAALVCTLAPSVAAQVKPALTHDDYDRWPSIRSAAYSADGKWIAYTVNPAWGDGTMMVQEVDGERRFSHARGSRPAFSADGRYLVFSESKSVVEARQKDLAKLRGEKSAELEAEAKKNTASEAKKASERRREMMARFSRGRGRGGRRGGGSSGGGSGALFILDLQTGKKEKIEKTKGYRLAKDGEFLVYHLPKPEESKAKAKKSTPAKPGAAETSKAKSGEVAGAERQRGRRSGRRRGGRRRGGVRSGSESAKSTKSTKSQGSSSSEGTVLVVRNLADGKEARYQNVLSYKLVAKDAWLLLTCKAKDPKLVSGLVAVPLAGGKRVTLLAGKASFSSITTDRHHKVLAFTSDAVEKAVADAKKNAAEAAKKKKKAAEAAKKRKAAEAAGKKKPAVESAKAELAGKKPAPKKPALKKPSVEKPVVKAAKPKQPSPRHDIYLWDFGSGLAQKIISHQTAGLPADHTISSSGLSFSGDGSVLSFSVRRKPVAPLAKILPNEKVVVDIWHWNDGKIQPQQAKGRGRSNRSLSCVWHIEESRLVVLGDAAVSSVQVFSRDGSRALASDSGPYEKLVTWDGRYSDYYLVNTIDGKRTRFLEHTGTRPSPSPSGRYMMHFGADYHWYLIQVADLSKRCLTKGLGVRFENELEDRPQAARAYGVVGWNKGETAVFLNDRYDIWRIDIESGDALCVTDGFGRANQIVLRYSRFDLEGDDDQIDADDRSYLPENMLLSAKNDRTKARGYYLDSTEVLGKPKKVAMFEDAIGGLTRAKKAERLFFTLSDFDRFPDLWVADLDFGHQRKLTDACPGQRSVRWGASELVNWTNSDGRALQGYLVKPEGFDPSKKYPMLVYFYERNADNVHRYVRPAPGTSPNAAYYVSNGYLWFVPDIVYTVGYPGESAEKCVISGVQHLIAKGFVDRQAIGIAGHSWGGYQTAHLVTRSNLFAAAESGAPVSNMFSAYGGIRYQSGMSRQFQYEKTQSRIGGTPWQYPNRYWQNSPVFYADRVQTPVLILHNDKDGAVPWTNGIEFFMALRRLGKEAYLFNYNGEPHGLRKDANKRDWARRMAEFFDHHLKGKPATTWMTKGVPYAEREQEKIQYARSFREAEAKKKAAAVEASSATGTGSR